MWKLRCASSVLCLTVVGATAAETAGQDLLRMTRLGGTATLEIGPVTPHAYLALLLLPDTVHDPGDLVAVLDAGAQLVHVARADAAGLFETTFEMAWFNTSRRVAVYLYPHRRLSYPGQRR